MIKIRPLHFVDMIRDIGNEVTSFKPYPDGNSYHLVASEILDNKDLLLEITLGPDDVCRTCKYHVGNVCTNTIDRSFRPDAPPSMQEWDLLINQRWCKRLGIKPGDRFTAKELCRMLKDHCDDMHEVYREIIDDRIAAKEAAVKRGVVKYLGADGI